MKRTRVFPAYETFRTRLLKPEKAHLKEFIEIIQSKISNGYIQSQRYLSIFFWIKKSLIWFFRDLLDLFGSETDIFQNLVKFENGQILITNEKGMTEFLHTSPKRYFLSKEKFDLDCRNMLDFIRWYNLLDCHLLAKAIESYAQGFRDAWRVNVHDFKSVRNILKMINIFL